MRQSSGKAQPDGAVRGTAATAKRWLGRVVAKLGPAAASRGIPAETVAARRLRLLSRWVETSARLVRLPVERHVTEPVGTARELLAAFLREEMGAEAVRFVPAKLTDPASPRISLPLTGTDEVMEVTEGPAWGTAELRLARKAAAMTGSVIASLDALAAAQAQSVTDPLTGLYNRRSLDRLLEREVLLARRHKVPLSVVLIDVDHFKQVNDQHGHAAGDRILKDLAGTLSDCLRRTDLAFRIGGDEFVVLLPQTPVSSAVAAMEKVRRAWAAVPAKHPHRVTLSMGIVEHRPGLTPAGLLSAADEALYEAKRADRNCLRVHRAAA